MNPLAIRWNKRGGAARRLLLLVLALLLGAAPSTQPTATTTVPKLLASAVPYDIIPTDRAGWTPGIRKQILDDLQKATTDLHVPIKVSFLVSEVNYLDKDAGRAGGLALNKSSYDVQGRLHPYEGVPVRILCTMDQPPKVGDGISFTAPLTLATFELDAKEPSGAWFLFSFNAAGVKEER
jgi:hypothetical protein